MDPFGPSQGIKGIKPFVLGRKTSISHQENKQIQCLHMAMVTVSHNYTLFTHAQLPESVEHDSSEHPVQNFLIESTPSPTATATPKTKNPQYPLQQNIQSKLQLQNLENRSSSTKDHLRYQTVNPNHKTNRSYLSTPTLKSNMRLQKLINFNK